MRSSRSARRTKLDHVYTAMSAPSVEPPRLERRDGGVFFVVGKVWAKIQEPVEPFFLELLRARFGDDTLKAVGL